MDDFQVFVSEKISPLESLNYAWDEWEAWQYITPLDEKLTAALEPVSRNALIGFGTAISIWIFRALEGHGKSSLFFSFLEAAAASSLEDPCLLDFAVDIDDWRGPANGPYAVSMTSVGNLIHDLGNLHIQANQIHYLKSLYCHIRPKSSAFDDWFNGCVNWLTKEELTKHLKPFGYQPGFFDVLDFVGYPIPLTAFITGERLTPAEREEGFQNQRLAISKDNPFYLGEI